MYTIGQISKIVNISKNALRYYDEISLLKPCELDKFSGYRYYSEQQVKDLLWIQELKYYGFTLNEVREILSNDQTLHRMLKEKLDILLKNLTEDNMRIKIIQRKLSELEKKESLRNTNLTCKNVHRQESEMKENDRNLILLVEDVAYEREIIKELLLSHGFSNIIECTNGQEAVEKYDELFPDLVISGITMPIMDGLYAFRLIKQKHKDAKIIYCSYMSHIPILLYALRTGGCVTFISKPITAKQLISSVIKAFEEETCIQMNTDFMNAIEQNLTLDSFGIPEDTIKNFGDLRLNQEEIEQFCNISSIEQFLEFKKASINQYLSNKKQEYDLFHLIKGRENCVDFQKVGMNIALQKEVNRQLIEQLHAHFSFKDFAVDFVNPHVINDYILENKENKQVYFYIDEQPIGGLCYSHKANFDIHLFLKCFIPLEQKALRDFAVEIIYDETDISCQTECILSTFSITQEDEKIVLFLMNEIY